MRFNAQGNRQNSTVLLQQYRVDFSMFTLIMIRCDHNNIMIHGSMYMHGTKSLKLQSQYIIVYNNICTNL